MHDTPIYERQHPLRRDLQHMVRLHGDDLARGEGSAPVLQPSWRVAVDDETLGVHTDVAAHMQLLPQLLLHEPNLRATLADEVKPNRRRAGHAVIAGLPLGRELLELVLNAYRGGLHRGDAPAPLACGARRHKLHRERVARPLARHLHEAQRGQMRHARSYAVLPQFFLEFRHDLPAVVRVVHVDEIDDYNATDIPDTRLPADLLDRLEVGLHNRVGETCRPRELARVDVNGRQRFSMIDVDVAASWQPHAAAQGPLDLRLDVVGDEDGVRALVELNAAAQFRGNLANEGDYLRMHVRVVDNEPINVLGEHVPDDLEDQAEVLVNERR